MNQYEVLYLITPELDEEAYRAVMDKFAGIITGNGGEVVKQDEWGKRKLAYAIYYKTEGSHVLVTFNAPADLPKDTWLPGRKRNPESNQARTEQQHERFF